MRWASWTSFADETFTLVAFADAASSLFGSTFGASSAVGSASCGSTDGLSAEGTGGPSPARAGVESAGGLDIDGAAEASSGAEPSVDVARQADSGTTRHNEHESNERNGCVLITSGDHDSGCGSVAEEGLRDRPFEPATVSSRASPRCDVSALEPAEGALLEEGVRRASGCWGAPETGPGARPPCGRLPCGPAPRGRSRQPGAAWGSINPRSAVRPSPGRSGQAPAAGFPPLPA